MSQEAVFFDLPPEWWTKQTINVTTFQYRGDCYTVSTVDLSQMPNYKVLQAIAQLRDILKPDAYLPAFPFETRLFVNGEDAHSMQSVYPTREEAEVGHRTCVERIQRMLASKEVGA